MNIGEGVRAQYSSHWCWPLNWDQLVFAQQNLPHVISSHHPDSRVTKEVRFVDASVFLAFHPEEFPSLCIRTTCYWHKDSKTHVLFHMYRILTQQNISEHRIYQYNHLNLCNKSTWRISWSVSPMKGKPIVPGGSGLPQLGSTRRINNISHNLTAARKSKTGSTMVQRKVTMRVYSPMLKRAKIAKELLERRCVFTRRLRAFSLARPYISIARRSPPVTFLR